MKKTFESKVINFHLRRLVGISVPMFFSCSISRSITSAAAAFWIGVSVHGGFVGALINQDEPPQENAPTKPERPYTISKETTYFTGPLKADGSIDFVAAVNEHFSRGVTPENNAARIIVPLISDEHWTSLEYRDQVFAFLEIDPSKRSNEFFTANAFAAAQSVDVDSLLAQLEQAKERPWSREEFPDLAQWLDANQPALEIIESATTNKYFFVPIIPDHRSDLLLTAHSRLNYLNCFRHIGTALAVRCNLRLGNQQWEPAWTDIGTIRAMSRWMAHGPTWIHLSLSRLLADTSCRAAGQYLNAAKVADIPWQELQASWADLIVLDFRDVYGITERATFLQLVCQVWDAPNESIWITGVERNLSSARENFLLNIVPRECIDFEPMAAHEPQSGAQFVDRLRVMIERREIDLDQLMRFANPLFDRAVKASTAPSYSEQIAIALPLNEEAYSYYTETIDQRETKIFDEANEDRTRSFAELLLGLDFPTVDTDTSRRWATEASQQLIGIGLSIREAQEATDRFPGTREEFQALVTSLGLSQPFDSVAFGFRESYQGIMIYHWGQNARDDDGAIDGDYPKDWGIRIGK